MRLGCFLAIASLLAGCGGDLEGEVAQQTYAASNNWTHYLQVDGNTIAEIDHIEVDGQIVQLDNDLGKLNKLKNKTGTLYLKPPGLACGVLIKTLLGVGNPTIGPGSPTVDRDISVISLKRDGSDARRWDIFEAFPEKWDPGEYSPSSNAACERVVAKMGSVELA